MAADTTTIEGSWWDGMRRRAEHAWRPFARSSRTSRVLIFTGVAIVVFFILMALFGEAIYGVPGDEYRFETAPGEFEQLPRLAEPSADYPFGTTRGNFDVLARIIGGARLALMVMAFAVALAMVIGVPLGLISGYRGGRLDRTLVTAMDAVYVFPPLLLAIVVSFMLRAYFSPGVPAAATAVGLVYIPQYFRVVRNHTMSVKEEPFVEAARALGAKERTILGRYVFFNVVQSVPVILTLNAADAILTLAALGFLGYGVQAPTPEWGYDISQALNDVSSGIWWTAFWPGVAIVVLVTALTLVGEGLNDVINPLLRARGAAGSEIEPEATHEPPADQAAAAEPVTETTDEGAANR